MPIFRKDGRTLLFIHVPKTGGSTIERVFRDDGWAVTYLDGRMGKGTENNVRRCTPQHMHGSMLESIFRLDRFDDIFLIARDPLARFRSEYLWRLRAAEKVQVDAVSVETWGLQALERLTAEPFLWDNHMRPQAEFVVPDARAYRFEDGLDGIVDDLRTRWQLQPQEVLPRIRDGRDQGAQHSSSDVAISERLGGALAETYAADFERFGYDDHQPARPARLSPARSALRALRRRS